MNKNKAVSWILSGLSVAGTVTVGVLSAIATPKAMEAIKKDYRENGIPGQYGFWDKVKVAWKYYIPAGSAALGTIGCELGVGVLNAKTQRSLTGAYALLDKSFKNYRNQVKNMLGKDADTEAMAADKEEGVEEASKEQHDEEDELFYDSYSNQYFHRTKFEVMQAEFELNRLFILRGWASLNDFYDLLNLKRTELGGQIGWSLGAGEVLYGYSWIDFEHTLIKLDDGLECYLIEHPFGPTADYLDPDYE